MRSGSAVAGLFVFSFCILELGVGCSPVSPFRKRPGDFDLEGETVRVSDVANPETQWLDSWDSAIEQAGREGKLVLANFTGSDWCSYCKKLDAEVFSTPEFADWAQPRVVLMKVDFPRKTALPPEISSQNDGLHRQYNNQIAGFPTVLILNSSGDVVGKLGYMSGGPKVWLREATRIANLHGVP